MYSCRRCKEYKGVGSCSTCGELICVFCDGPDPDGGPCDHLGSVVEEGQLIDEAVERVRLEEDSRSDLV